MTNEELKALALAATGVSDMSLAPDVVLGLIADNEHLGSFKAAYMEWSDKTDWVQETAEVRELGKHRADVIRDRLDALKAECEGLRKDAARYRFVSQLAWYVDRAAYVYDIGNQKAVWADQREAVDADQVEDAIDAVMGQGGQSNDD